jgi:hypothetical protein|tara:strand:+ start:224 stop:445 length:222 start_codon:yes stop_codon:yes gene_type:complete
MVRNYKREYALSGAKPNEKKNRASRNKVRRRMLKTGAVRKGDGKDIDHIDKNPRNNSRSNLRVVSKRVNRAKK